ncbi:MAG: DNA polymerase III subunit [Lachnospiraceae bacterium]|nr:DNA polymerase III subunit [Lachnospiraceae bacterium]
MAGFRDIVGHGQVIEHLKNAVCMDTVSHAYIINGPDHAGKRMLAEAFAMTLQCETVQAQLAGSAGRPRHELLQGSETVQAHRDIRTEPCMECRSCRQAAGKNQPDIIYVTHDKTAISVGDIRVQINQDIIIKPYSSKYKIYIVDEAEKMNIQAQNALLKTLEEPPPYAVILLLTANTDAFLPTICSRCVTLNLKAVEDDKIRAVLMERYHVPDYQADISVAFAQGNVGRAILLASSEQFASLRDYVVQMVRRIGDMPSYDMGKELETLLDRKEDIPVFFDLLLLLFRDVLLYKAAADEEHLIFQGQSHMIKQMAGRSTFSGLELILQAIGTADRRIRANVNAPLTLELLLMNIKENIA